MRPTNARSLKYLRLSAAALTLALSGLVFAQTPDNPISFRSEIYVVSEVTAEDGSKEERFSAATSAIPGQVVEFRIIATNAGETTLPAGRVQIYGPVEGDMAYVGNSASPSAENRLLTEFSVDGTEFSEPPVLIGAGDSRRVADPNEFTMIRWTLLTPLEPGQEVTLVYRVVIE